ncbi:hypothetical protein [Streptomyces sp. CC0208]|uniref:hypothetical protein n=1 Tax=Streptomyces sp. CC0208 TaxID=2306165 RepID=UPI001968E159|nr:hypothetical protein [Streptomyces sp. CC0208]
MPATANRRLPTLPGRRAVLLTLRRPVTGPAADTMAAPGHPHVRRVPDERTQQ